MHKAGEKIRTWRQAKSLTAQDLGDLIGACPAQTVYGWEKHGKRATPTNQRRLIELGICTADDWLQPASCPAEAIAQ